MIYQSLFNRKSVLLGVSLLGLLAVASPSHGIEIRSGAYAGALIGSGQFKNTINESLFFIAADPVPAVGQRLSNGNTTTPLTSKKDSRGLNFSGFAGIREVLKNNFVMGAEVSLSKNSGDLVHDFTRDTTPDGNAASTTSTKLTHTLTVTPSALIGYKVMSELLIAGKVGVAVGNFEVTNTFNLKDAGSTDVVTTEKFVSVGVEAGVMVEYALTEALSLVGDVSVTIFPTTDPGVDFANPTSGRVPANELADATHSATFKPSFLVMRIGMAYRF